MLMAASCSDNSKMKGLLEQVPADADVVLVGSVKTVLESAGGKSSLLSFIFGLRNDYNGEILFDSTDIRTISVPQWCDIRTSTISLLPQDMGLFPELTVDMRYGAFLGKTFPRDNC